MQHTRSREGQNIGHVCLSAAHLLVKPDLDTRQQVLIPEGAIWTMHMVGHETSPFDWLTHEEFGAVVWVSSESGRASCLVIAQMTRL